MTLRKDITSIAERAVKASRRLALLESREKNSILKAMAKALELNRNAILTANQLDVEEAGKAGLSTAMIDRLKLSDSRIKAMAEGLRTAEPA